MLFTKARRAIWRNKKAYMACVFLIAVGILLHTAMGIAVTGLEGSMLGFYKDYNFSDVFAKVSSMPMSAVSVLEGIPGIKRAEGRYVAELRAGVDGSDELITLRLVSADPENSEGMNRLLVTGNELANRGDILINPAFYTAHNLTIGDSIYLYANGREYAFSVSGTAISPEYVYITKDLNQLLPDEAGFGIGYISNESMASLMNSGGVANDIVFSLEEGYAFDDVKPALEDALARYGLRELIPRKNQLSHSFLDMEVSSIKSVSTAMPMLFVLMAAVVLYLMMKRLIEQERTQIGTLKAFGCSNAQIVGHYLLYGGITGLTGGLIGCFLGYLASGGYLTLFLEFFMLPSIDGSPQPGRMALGLAIAIAGGLLGAFAGAFKVLKMEPAESMRPPSPRPVKYDILGRLRFLGRILTSQGRMAFRSITRNPVRSAFVVVGIMFSYGLLSLSGSFDSMVDKMIISQFTDIQKYGVKITLERPLDYTRSVEAAYSLPGVTLAEGLLEIPSEVKSRNITEGVVLTGINAGSSLYAVCDTNTGRAYSPSSGGVILSNAIAEKLRVEAGESIIVRSPLKDEDIRIPVTRVIEQNLGTGAYMELEALCGLFGTPKTATAIILNTSDLPALKDYLKTGENAAVIEDKESTLKKYRDMMAMYSSMYLIMEIMGAAVAFAIIYNTSTISLSERKREYATLRLMGMSVPEVSSILNLEYTALGVVGMAAGIPFTLFLNGSLNNMVDTSMFSMPSALPLRAYIIGVIGCVAAMVLSGLSARKKIRNFDMVEVLKERE